MPNFIFTNHVRKRMKERKISKDMVVQTLTHFTSKHTQSNGNTEYKKVIAGRTSIVLAKRSTTNELIIISCWINPPFPGTKDARLQKRYHQMRKARGMKKILLYLLYKLGI